VPGESAVPLIWFGTCRSSPEKLPLEEVVVGEKPLNWCSPADVGLRLLPKNTSSADPRYMPLPVTLNGPPALPLVRFSLISG